MALAACAGTSDIGRSEDGTVPTGVPPAEEDGPTSSDHWHSASAIYVCGEVHPLVYPDDSSEDATGIHSHGDSLIHVHPYAEKFAGAGATLGVFFDEIEVAFDDHTLELPDGTVLREGEFACGDGTAELRVLQWESLDAGEPTIFTEGLRNIRLSANGQLFRLAWVSAATPNEVIPRPDDAFLRDYLSVPAGPSDERGGVMALLDQFSTPDECEPHGQPSIGGDFDGDGATDLAMFRSGSSTLLVCLADTSQSDEGPTFGAGEVHSVAAGGGGEVLAAVDLNADGTDEILTGVRTPAGSSAEVVAFAGGRLDHVRTPDRNTLMLWDDAAPDRLRTYVCLDGAGVNERDPATIEAVVDQSGRVRWTRTFYSIDGHQARVLDTDDGDGGLSPPTWDSLQSDFVDIRRANCEPR
jgi:hypothetical protein